MSDQKRRRRGLGFAEQQRRKRRPNEGTGDYFTRRERTDTGPPPPGPATDWDTPWPDPGNKTSWKRQNRWMMLWDDEARAENEAYANRAYKSGKEYIDNEDPHYDAMTMADRENYAARRDGRYSRQKDRQDVITDLDRNAEEQWGGWFTGKADEEGVTPEGQRVKAKWVFGRRPDGSTRRANNAEVGELVEGFTGHKPREGLMEEKARKRADRIPQNREMGENENAVVEFNPGWDDEDPAWQDDAPYRLRVNPNYRASPDEMAKTLGHELGHLLQLAHQDDRREVLEMFRDAFPDLVAASARRRGKQWASTAQEAGFAYYLGDADELMAEAILVYMTDPDAIRNTKAGRLIRYMMNNGPVSKHIKFASTEETAIDPSTRGLGFANA